MQDLGELLDDGVINHRNQVPFDTVADAVAMIDEGFEQLLAKLDGMDEAAWAAPGRFLFGGQLVMEAPREQLAWMMLLDAVHHRGQLSTHLRPMGSKVPAMYGPSADDEGPSH